MLEMEQENRVSHENYEPTGVLKKGTMVRWHMTKFIFIQAKGIVPEKPGALLYAQYGRTGIAVNYDVTVLIWKTERPFRQSETFIVHYVNFIMISSRQTPTTSSLTFFAGSATTAHAVMQLNAEDGGNRRFIMIQLPEKSDEKSEAFNVGYENIADISKERIRRAGRKIKTRKHRSGIPIGYWLPRPQN